MHSHMHTGICILLKNIFKDRSSFQMLWKCIWNCSNAFVSADRHLVSFRTNSRKLWTIFRTFSKTSPTPYITDWLMNVMQVVLLRSMCVLAGLHWVLTSQQTWRKRTSNYLKWSWIYSTEPGDTSQTNIVLYIVFKWWFRRGETQLYL